MRRALGVSLGIALAMVAATSGTAVAAGPPTRACYGHVAAGIASTWPWAHNDKVAFSPAPGAIALWVQEFGPGLGISSVRELQILFCSE